MHHQIEYLHWFAHASWPYGLFAFRLSVLARFGHLKRPMQQIYSAGFFCVSAPHFSQTPKECFCRKRRNVFDSLCSLQSHRMQYFCLVSNSCKMAKSPETSRASTVNVHRNAFKEIKTVSDFVRSREILQLLFNVLLHSMITTHRNVNSHFLLHIYIVSFNSFDFDSQIPYNFSVLFVVRFIIVDTIEKNKIDKQNSSFHSFLWLSVSHVF